MKIAILGAHAGVHFLSKKFLEDKTVEKIYHIPANPGIQPDGRYVPMDLLTADEIVEFLETTELDFVFITTIDFLRRRKIHNKLEELGIPSCSVSFDLAKLEWSKAKGKALLQQLDIPTPSSTTLTYEELKKTFKKLPRPFVMKYDEDWRAGLQSVVVTDDNYLEEYKDLVKYGKLRFMKGFGQFEDQKFVVEEFINGKREYSYHAICNEKSWQYIGSSRDYKKFNEGDTGFNTASMGCYSPVSINPDVHTYVEKIRKHLKKQGTPYTGFLYLGIMEDQKGKPYVLEINTRPGDPELQSILMTHDESQSFVKILHQVATNKKISKIKFNNKHGVCVRIVNSDYRNIVNLMNSGKTDTISNQINPYLWPAPPGVYISYNKDRKLLNSVLTTSGSSRKQASDKLYKFLDSIDMFNFTYRSDIGYLK